MKRSISLASLIAATLVGLALTGVARAEVAPEDPNDSLPDVVVQEVALEGSATTRSAGSVIRGVATVSNPSEYPAVVTFDNGLVGEFDEKDLPAAVYAVDYGTEELALDPGETAKVSFALKIPAGLNEDGVALKVRARLVGSLYRGWGYSERFSVEGDGGFAEISSAYFTLADGQTVSAASGPTVYPDSPRDSVPLSVVLESRGAAVSLTPVVSVKNRSGVAGEASARRLPTVAVPAEGSVTATVPFTHAGQAPGVYEGEISWVDAAGAERAPRLGFRYIVAGQSATVHAVSSSASSVEAGESFVLSLKFSGTPTDLNVASGTARVSEEVSRVEVRVVDAAGETVAEDSYAGVLPVLGEVEFELRAAAAAAAMVAQVSVLDADGGELFKRDFPVSAGKVFSPVPEEVQRPWPLAFPLAASTAAIALLVAMVAWRRGSQRLALGAVLAGAAAWAFASSVVSATNVRVISTQSDEYCSPSVIYINSPAAQATVGCYDGLRIEGTVSYAYCTNSGGEGISEISVRYGGSTLYGPVQAAYASIGVSGGHDHPYIDSAFSLSLGSGYFTRNGNHNVLVEAQSFNTACTSAATGARQFTVSGCDVCSNVDGIQTSVTSGWVKDTCGDEPGNCYEVRQPTSCEVDNLRTVLPDPATWTATGCDTTCVWADGSTGTTETIVSSAPGELTTTVKSMKSIPIDAVWESYSVTHDDGSVTWHRRIKIPACVNTEYSAPLSCEATIVVEDLCGNMAGVQNPVPAGLSRNGAGECLCPTGSTYDAVDDRCEDDDGNCTTCGGTGTGGGCPVGTKYCNGVCIDADAACATTVVTDCPLVPPESQYCVEVYNRSGVTYLGFTAAQLEQIFGYALPDAARDQLRAGFVTPIFGAVGRALTDAGSLDAKYGSSGCGGALCAFGSKGCLTTIDPTTNDPVADCVSPNDPTGAGGVPPSAILEVEPSVVGLNGHCNVYWGSHEMQTCTVSGNGLTPPKASLAGTFVTPDLTSSATYNLVCTGTDGRTYSDSDTCAVNPDVVEF